MLNNSCKITIRLPVANTFSLYILLPENCFALICSYRCCREFRYGCVLLSLASENSVLSIWLIYCFFPPSVEFFLDEFFSVSVSCMLVFYLIYLLPQLFYLCSLFCKSSHFLKPFNFRASSSFVVLLSRILFKIFSSGQL